MSSTPPQQPPESDEYKPLHPLPRGLVELYGFLAVLVVLIPEWMASGALQGLLSPNAGAPLPTQTRAWRRLPELRLASMSLAELRVLARQCGLRGYAGLSRERLVVRLLRLIRRQQKLDAQDQAPLKNRWSRQQTRLFAALVLLLLTLLLVVAGGLLLL